MLLDDNDIIKVAIEEGNVVQLKRIVSEFGLDYSPSWEKGYAPLRYAVSKKQWECAEILVDASVQILTDERKTQLILEVIATSNSANLLQKLLAKFPEQVRATFRNLYAFSSLLW